jgi:hypothetical protein
MAQSAFHAQTGTQPKRGRLGLRVLLGLVILNLPADSTNPDLIGALTRLHSPLTLAEVGWGNVIVVETPAFGMIAFGVWLWLRQKQVTA